MFKKIKYGSNRLLRKDEIILRVEVKFVYLFK
jgi:hypothetical protein